MENTSSKLTVNSAQWKTNSRWESSVTFTIKQVLSFAQTFVLATLRMRDTGHLSYERPCLGRKEERTPSRIVHLKWLMSFSTQQCRISFLSSERLKTHRLAPGYATLPTHTTCLVSMEDLQLRIVLSIFRITCQSNWTGCEFHFLWQHALQEYKSFSQWEHVIEERRMQKMMHGSTRWWWRSTIW